MILSSDRSGMLGSGRLDGMPPNLVPMVWTWKAEKPRRAGSQADGDEHTRPMRAPSAQAEDDDHRRERHARGRRREA